MKITPAWRVYVLGATLCVALTICSRNFGDRGGPYFMVSLSVAGIAYLLAIREFFRGRGARATRERTYNSIPAIDADIRLAMVPASIARMPSRASSPR